MKQYFTFDNLPLTILIVLIAFSWFSALSVIFFHWNDHGWTAQQKSYLGSFFAFQEFIEILING